MQSLAIDKSGAEATPLPRMVQARALGSLSDVVDEAVSRSRAVSAAVGSVAEAARAIQNSLYTGSPLGPSIPDPDDKIPFVLCTTRDISAEEGALLESYGRVERFDRCHSNVPLNEIKFDYFIISMIDAPARLYFRQFVLPAARIGAIHMVLYREAWEHGYNLQFEAEFDTIPPRQANRKLFNQLLLTVPLMAQAEPASCLSFGCFARTRV